MKNVRNTARAFAVVIMALGVFIFTSCESGKTKQQAESQRDSLMNVNAKQQQSIDDMDSTISAITSGMDSLAIQENILVSSSDKEGNKLNKQQILTNLKYFRTLLSERKTKLDEMKNKLSNNKGSMKKMSKLIAYLEAQLDEKTKTIADLQSQLEKKNADISLLNEKVGTLNSNVASLQGESTQQKAQIQNQENALAEVYYVIGTKKELSANGLLTGGGLFAKKKVDYSAVAKSKFKQGDKRNISSINIEGRNPKILSGVPVGSYSIQQNSNTSYTLKIIDADKFWSISKFLIVEIK